MLYCQLIIRTAIPYSTRDIPSLVARTGALWYTVREAGWRVGVQGSKDRVRTLKQIHAGQLPQVITDKDSLQTVTVRSTSTWTFRPPAVYCTYGLNADAFLCSPHNNYLYPASRQPHFGLPITGFADQAQPKVASSNTTIEGCLIETQVELRTINIHNPSSELNSSRSINTLRYRKCLRKGQSTARKMSATMILQDLTISSVLVVYQSPVLFTL